MGSVLEAIRERVHQPYQLNFNGIIVEISNMDAMARIKLDLLLIAERKFGIKPVSLRDILETLKEQRNGNGVEEHGEEDIFNAVISDSLPGEVGNYWRVKEIHPRKRTAVLEFCDMLGTGEVLGVKPFEIPLDKPLATSFAVAHHKKREQAITLYEASVLIRESKEGYPPDLINPPYRYFYADSEGKLKLGKSGPWIITSVDYGSGK